MLYQRPQFALWLGSIPSIIRARYAQPDAARKRLQSDKERVHGLIQELRDEGLDQEEADQVGDLSHVPQPPLLTASNRRLLQVVADAIAVIA